MNNFRLKEERERLELTQTALAELVSVSKRTVIDWEKGLSSPTAVQLSALHEAGADVLYIVGGERSQALPEVELLPADERVLLDSYRACNPQARRTLIQTATLMSVGMGAVAGHSQGGVRQSATGDGSVQIGQATGGSVSVRTKRG